MTQTHTDLIAEAKAYFTSPAVATSEARRHVATLITALRAAEAENARLREANGILEDALQEVGDDYPGSSCQEWCQQQVAAARRALGGSNET